MAPTPKHSSIEAARFLARFHPEPDALLVLTSIIPDGKSWTETFTHAQLDEMVEWIEARQGKQNLYFMVNPPLHPLTNKASKEEVARLAWLHVDIDPRAGENLEEEQARIEALLKDKLPPGVPPPSVTIRSGGGWQAFWRLNPSDRLIIDGRIDKAEELEAYNQHLEKLFGADHTFNVDRIMRIPHTLNLPTKKKVKKGRVVTLATPGEFSDRSYDIEQFTAAPRVQTATKEGELSGGRPKLKISGNVPDIGVDELREWAQENGKAISDHTCALIATGSDPVDPTKYPSRSEALFRVVCDLVRADVPDDMIYGVITGSNEIAASVKDKPNHHTYALRQIERAHEEAIDPQLRELNEKHAVISDYGGKVVVLSERVDRALDRATVSWQTFEAFRNRYMNRTVIVGEDKDGTPVEAPLGAWWLKHRARRQYESVIFAPGREVIGDYNLWRGFTYEPIRGERHHSFLEHIRDNVCSNNREHYHYLICWMARLVQQPGVPGEVAVILRGKQGTGKSFFATHLGKLFGRHFLQVSNSQHLVGNFNLHLRDISLLFGDEAFYAGDKKHESVLKTLITERQLVIEGKGVDAVPGPNYVHLILASNEDWVVPAGLDDRRLFVMEVGEGKKQDRDYFRRIVADLSAGGYENLLDFLLTYDLEGFDVGRDRPKTDVLQEQKEHSLPPLHKYVYGRLLEGAAPRNALVASKCWSNWNRAAPDDYFITARTILEDMRALGGPATKLPDVKVIGKLLRQLGLSVVTSPKLPASVEGWTDFYTDDRGIDGYLWNVEDMRRAWNAHFGPGDWPKPEPAESEQKPLATPF